MDDIIYFLQQQAALIVSLCAIGLTLQQGWAARKHNRISVKPKLTTFSEKKSVQNKQDLIMYQITLSNHGLGPAFIESFEFLIDGKPIKSEEPSEIYKTIKNATKLQLDDHLWTIGVLRKEHVMGKDTSEIIAQVAFIQNDSAIEDLKRFHARVVYKSAYGEMDTYDTRYHD